MDTLPDPLSVVTGPNADSSEVAEADVVAFVRDRFEAARAFDRPFKAAALDDLRYLNSLLPDDWPHYWGFFYPETLATARDVVEHVMGSFFEQEEVFGIRGEEGQDEVRTQLQLELLKYILREAEYKVKVYLWLQEAVHFGNGWVYTGVRPKRRKFSRQSVTPYGVASVEVDRVELLPYMHAISRFDMFPAECGELEDEMPYLIWREWVPLQQFRARARWSLWRHADDVQGVLLIDRDGRSASTADGDVWDDVYGRMRAMGYAVGESPSFTGRGAARLVELWHYYESGDDGEGFGRYAIVADRKHLVAIGDAHDEEKPICGVKYAPVPMGGAVWQGQGIPALIRAYQDEINVRTAQEADAVEYFLKPMRLVGPGVLDQPSKLLPWPGQVIPTQGDVNQIKMLEMPGVPPALAYNRERAQIGIQRMSRVTDISRGVGVARGLVKGSETATGLALLSNLSQRAATFQMLYFEERGVVRQLNQMARLAQRTMVGEQLLDVTDNPRLRDAGLNGLVILNPEDVAGNWRVYLVASTRAVQTVDQARALAEFLDWLSRMPGMRERIDWMKVAQVIGPMMVRRGLSDLFKSAEEIAAEAQQQLAVLLGQSAQTVQ